MRAVAGLAPQELESQFAAGNFDTQKLAQIARARKKNQPLKSTPQQLESARRRYYRSKGKNKQPAPPKAPLSSAQKFERYWTRELALIREFFSSEELDKVASYWAREFQRYRTEVEQRKQERANALAHLRQTALARKEAATSEAQ
jgi:hypothetical protein